MLYLHPFYEHSAAMEKGSVALGGISLSHCFPLYAGGFALHEATLMSWIRQDGDDGRGRIFCAEKEFLQVALARAYLNWKFLYVRNEFLIRAVMSD